MTSWNELRRDHGAAIARVAASYAPPGPDREDLLQEIAIALVQALPQHRGDASVKTYALRIAHNVGLRQALRRPRWEEEVEVADPSPGAPARLLAQGEAERLHAAIRTLPIAQRQVITLALEELSHEQIAETLGISENAVATRLHRAKAQLKLRLETR